MKSLLLLVFVFIMNLCMAQTQNDSIVIVNKNGPNILNNDTADVNTISDNGLEQYEYRAAISIDIANFLTSQIYLSLEIPFSKRVSGVLQFNNLLYQGINVVRTSTIESKELIRNQMYGLGIRLYNKDKSTKGRSAWYVQPQIYLGNADVLTGLVIPKYRTNNFSAGALNVGYSGIKHRGLFVGFDAGVGLIKIVNLDNKIFFRLGLEAGFAL